MSEIPFVNRLGEALEQAAAADQRAPARRRRRRRRFGGLAVAALVLGAGGVTTAAILDDPEKLATQSIACYDRASLEANVAVPGDDGRAPADVCADVLQTQAPLAACVRAESVAVFPGPPETCARLGLRPLPEGYDTARNRVATLSRELREVEEHADCVEPERLVRQAQAVLDRLRWRGWRAVLRGGDAGPCGWVHVAGGDARPTLGGALEPGRRELAVGTGPPRSLFRQLYGKGSAADRLFDDSGARCFSVDELRDHARRLLAPTGLSVSFALETEPQPAYETLEPPERQRRYDEGCAIIEGAGPVYPAADEIAIEVVIRVKRS